MLKLKILVYMLAAMFLISIVNAAAIHGTVYDLSLKKINNVKVEINTSPKQLLIAQNSSYLFNVPNGAYTIKAQLMQKNDVIASVQENITIRQDDSYVLDLILFPDVEEGVGDIGIDVDGNAIETEQNQNKILIGFFIVLAFIIILVVAHYSKKNKKEGEKTAKDEVKKEENREDGDLGQIVKIIEQEGGRATQKDIRKKIPLSEAKISLMIAELEHRGVIEKIKKGRGNIIILK